MRALAVILLPVLVQLAIGAAWSKTAICPEPEDLYPCTCSASGIFLKITCAAVSMPGALEALSRNKKILREQTIHLFSLTDVAAERLPSLLFSGLRVSQLNIEDCRLKDLADYDGAPAFAGILDLVTLHISNCIKGKTTLHLEHLESLRLLLLWNNNIPEISNDVFRNGPYNLVSVIIHGCGVRTIGDRAFETLTKLEYLELSGNLFHTFSRSMLPNPAASLRNLDLHSSNLSSLPEDIFVEMPSLKQVHLQMNSIGRLPEATWSSIWSQMIQISLQENPLECDAHIEWIFKMKKPFYIFGSCVSPEKRKGKTLTDLISENQKSTV